MRPEAATEILQYFLDHPEAADTLYGIARWRLLETTIHQSIDTTDRALRWLVEQGLLVEESAVGADPIFRLNADKGAEAARLAKHD